MLAGLSLLTVLRFLAAVCVVSQFPFDDHNCPSFEDLPFFCKDVADFLSEHEKNVACIHCKAGKGRTGQWDRWERAGSSSRGAAGMLEPVRRTASSQQQQ